MSQIISLIGKKTTEIKELVLSAPKNAVFLVKLDQVKMLQSREQNDEKLIEEYIDAIANGAKFPPGSVVFDPELLILFLTDGIHRAVAHDKTGKEGFLVTIRTGTEAEALLAASGSNASHGKKRSNKDKEHAVLQVLRHPILCRYSNNYLAKEAKVSPQLVDKLREMLEKDPDNPVRSSGCRLAQRGGKTYEVSVSKKADGDNSDDAPKETPETVIENVVKRIIAGIEKAMKSFPEELRGAFAREMMRGFDIYFGTETIKS